jgi:Prokaryotic phospholipase A2
MRVHLRVLVAVTSVLTVASPVSAGSPSPHPQVRTAAADLAVVEQLMFRAPMWSFLQVTRDPWFDWSTDLCSAPLVGSTGRSFDFRDACRRHDFGYRNLRLLERRYGSGSTYWNRTSRKRVDRQLLSDMKDHCSGRAWYDQITCVGWAETFYAAVRLAPGP